MAGRIFDFPLSCELLVLACGIYFSDQGLNPGWLHGELKILATGPPEKSLNYYFFIMY